MKKLLLYAFLPALFFGALLVSGCSSGNRPVVRVMTFNIRLSPREDFDGDNCWNNRRSGATLPGNV